MILVLRDTTDINILNAHSSTRIVVLPPEKRRLQRRQLLSKIVLTEKSLIRRLCHLNY